MRKIIPIQPDGSIQVPKSMVEDIFGKARQAVIHLRPGCLVIAPVTPDIEAGDLPEVLARLHRFEALDAVLTGHFDRGDREPVQFEGDLSVLALHDVFLFLSASKKSGVLIVQEQSRWGFFFQSGAIVFATGDDPRFSLAAFLLKHQLVTEQDLAQAARSFDKPVDALKSIWGVTGLSTEKFREQWIQCIEDIIFRVFTLGRGRFTFLNGEAKAPFAFDLPTSTTSYVMEATRRIDEWARIEGRVPPDDTVLEVAEDVTASAALSPEEEQVMSQINGQRNLAEVIAGSKTGDMDGKRAVASLIAAGVIKGVRPPAHEAVPTPAPGLPPEDCERLKSRIERYNAVFSAIYQALSLEVGGKTEVILGAFAKGLEPGSSLLAGIGLLPDGTLPADALLSRLADLSSGREEVLVKDLNELLYFQLFAVKNSLGPEMESGIVEMAKTLLAT